MNSISESKSRLSGQLNEPPAIQAGGLLPCLAALALALTVPVREASGQGTVFLANVIANNGSPGLTTHIWGPYAMAPDLSLVGFGSNDTTTRLAPTNTINFAAHGMTMVGQPGGLPAATTFVQLLGVDAPTSALMPESSLVPVGQIATFRTQTSVAGTIVPITDTLFGSPGITAGDAFATFELVAWDNSSNLYSNWTQASVAWQEGLIAAGKSGLFQVSAIGGGLNVVPYLNNMQDFNSFNLYANDQPSPVLAVATLPPTALTATSATLNATVNPNGYPTAAWFQWGISTSYGNLTPVTDVGSGTNALPLSAPLAGLAPGVTYHFRVAATNSNGAAYGSDQSFTTLGPPEVWGVSAWPVFATSASLSAEVSPNGYSTAAWFQWGPTTNYGNLTAATDIGSTSFTSIEVLLVGLTGGVTYHFRVAATNSYGAVYGNDQSFTTLPGPAAWTLSATAVTNISAMLNATVNPDGFPTAAWFQWGATTSYGSLTAATDMGSGTNDLPLAVPLAGLMPGVTYHFRVAATNSQGAAYGNDFMLGTLDVGPPEVWTSPATDVTATSATLDSSVGAHGYPTAAWFQWGVTTNYGNLTAATDMGSAQAGGGFLDVPLVGLNPGITYHFRVAATNSYGAVYGNDQSFTTLTGPAVVTLSATTATPTSAMLNATVNPYGYATAAWFQWGTTTNYGNLTAPTDMGSGTNELPLSIPLAGLTPGVAYHFRAVATNSPQVVYGSDQSFTTARVQPIEVWTLAASAVTYNSATLNGTVNPNGYPSGAWFQWGTTTNYGNATAATDMGSGTNALPLAIPVTGLTPGVTYHFRVAASNSPAAVYGNDQSFATPPGATGVVYNCTEAALRSAMAGGGTVTFACDGTITLASTITNAVNVTLDGSGRSVAISGPGAFYVSSNSTLGVVALTIANCTTAPMMGGGIFNDFGTLNLAKVIFQTNWAGYGGAIYNHGGTLNATNCTFDSNGAIMEYEVPNQQPPPVALGGAIFNELGAVNLQQCLFTSNRAVGASSFVSPGVAAYGGAVCGNLVAYSCTFVDNAASGGNGANGASGGPGGGLPGSPGQDGAAAYGGAIYGGGTLINCTFAANTASAGSGGAGGDGAPGNGTGGSGGGGGNGASASGGAICGGPGATLVNCTFVANTVSAGGGGCGGNGGGVTLMGTSNGGAGGAGGNGGQSASGGAISGAITLVNCTVAYGSATGGSGGSGGAGGSAPLGSGPPGAPGASGSAGGGGTSGATLVNTLLATNAPGNCSGCGDGGHNQSSDGSCAFTNVGCMNNTDPKLGPLANNGGPTLTMALLPGSPAIDAGNTALAPATDQRGFPRPAGLAADIGAFEYGSVMPTVAISRSGANGLNILGSGNPGQPCRLLSSTDMLNWVPIASSPIGSGGTIQFIVNCAPGGACRFYRLVMP